MNIDNLNQMIEYIDQNLTEKIDYNQLAKIVGLSTQQFQRIFNYLTDMSVSEYIRKRRLSMAYEDLKNTNLNGAVLIIVLFLISAVSTLFNTNATSKWAILSTSAVPAFMNSSLSPEFAQVISRFGESATLGITPLLAYFTIYIAYIEKYNQNDEPISFSKTIKYQLVYSFIIGASLLLILIGWYLIGLPLGIGGSLTT